MGDALHGPRLGGRKSHFRRIITKGRHRTPGRFRTRVINEGVTPCVYID